MNKLFLFLFLLISFDVATWGGGKVVVNVSGIRNDDGMIKLTLYNNEEGFPTKPEKAIQTVSEKIRNGKVTLIIEGLKPGTYAFALLHDENNNKKSDSNWFGLPTEGVAASNNAEGSFGPPKFRDASFQVEGNTVVQNIKMVYL